METIKKLLSDILNIEFVQAVLSNPRKKEGILKGKGSADREKRQFIFSTGVFYKNTGLS